MEQKSENEKLIIRYLLGDLPEEELKNVEDRYFSNDSYLEEMAIVEEDLIDDYLRGRLIGHQREQFEDHYLVSPARRNRVEFSKTLIKSLSGARVSTAPVRRESSSWLRSLFNSRNRSLQFAFSAAALLAVATAAWLLFENLSLRNDINRLQTERATLEQREKEIAEQSTQQRERNDELMARLESEQNERQQLEQQIARLQPQASVEFELVSNATRGSSTTKSFNIPSGTKTVRLKLYLEPDDYKIYRAALQNTKGEKVWSKTGLRARTTSSGKEIIVSLPAELFSSGNYTLTLGGATANGDYENVSDCQFKVLKRS